MDLRSIRLRDIRAALLDYHRLLEVYRLHIPAVHARVTKQLASGAPIRHIDARTGLALVFAMRGLDAHIITTFWRGHTDPKIPAQGCPL